MLRIGLTGVIGCGKSVVANLLHQRYGIPIIDMDQAGRAAIDAPGVLSQLTGAFGRTILDRRGRLVRRRLGRIVFAEEGQRRRLNDIVHPAMLAIARQWMQEAAQQHPAAPYLVVDAALIFELAFDRELDRVVTVAAPLESCIARAAARDRLTPAEVEQRFAAQLPQEEKCRRADYLLVNDGSIEELGEKTAALHAWLAAAAPAR